MLKDMTSTCLTYPGTRDPLLPFLFPRKGGGKQMYPLLVGVFGPLLQCISITMRTNRQMVKDPRHHGGQGSRGWPRHGPPVGRRDAGDELGRAAGQVLAKAKTTAEERMHELVVLLLREL